jgi:hypothetical protein
VQRALKLSETDEEFQRAPNDLIRAAQRAEAVSQKLPLQAIQISERHHKDMGDIEALACSIREVGLQHPVVVTPSGELGWCHDFSSDASQRKSNPNIPSMRSDDDTDSKLR